MSTIDTLLLLALPASGKSEIRRYLASLDPARALSDFRLGPTVQLDDYPYVRLMALIDAVIEAETGSRAFFEGEGGLLAEPRDWGTLAVLLAQDHRALGSPKPVTDRPGAEFIDRIVRARARVGAAVPPVLSDDAVRRAVERQVGAEAADTFRSVAAEQARYRPGNTVVVEFARGGPAGAGLPLPEPHGYRYSLPFLGPDMLGRASILYVWVTPEDSRARNAGRAQGEDDAEAAVIHHRVPERVMIHDYGTDDLLWLTEQGAGRVPVTSGGSQFLLPTTVFDNRADYTTFLRADPSDWPPSNVTALHNRLLDAFDELDAAR